MTLRDVANAVREAGIAGLPSAVARADNARYQEIDVRSALASTTGMPFRWTLNPYRGCTHACEYCYARKYQRHLELGAGDDFSSVILVKRNLPAALRREVGRRTWTHETVAVGTATDPYQPIEGHYRLTRRCLEVLADADTPFSIVTKGPMIVRDQDVLMRASARAGCQVYMSVPSVDERAWSALEPGTAPPAQRLRAIRQLADAGVSVGVLMMPLVPGISTSRSSIEQTLKAIAEAGVPLSGSCVARFDPGAREHFFNFLQETFPDLLERYERLYAGAHAAADYVRGVRRVVADEAGKAGLARSSAPSC
ncbi:MAG: radical SAM protein [Acidobacteria bacterium]|nr:radical SAM protein [Acidobacteriota bacterium]